MFPTTLRKYYHKSKTLADYAMACIFAGHDIARIVAEATGETYLADGSFHDYT